MKEEFSQNNNYKPNHFKTMKVFYINYLVANKMMYISKFKLFLLYMKTKFDLSL